MLTDLFRRGRTLIVASLIVSAGAVACTSSSAGEPSPDTAAMVEVETTGPEMREVAAMYRTAERTERYVFALFVSAVEWDRWWDQAMADWHAEQARLAAEAAAASSSGGGYSGGGHSGAGGECGGSQYDYVMDEESGIATQWNTQGSSAWGCYQIIASTWASSCSDLGVHGEADAAAQAACANRLPASAWNASQG